MPYTYYVFVSILCHGVYFTLVSSINPFVQLQYLVSAYLLSVCTVFIINYLSTMSIYCIYYCILPYLCAIYCAYISYLSPAFDKNILPPACLPSRHVEFFLIPYCCVEFQDNPLQPIIIYDNCTDEANIKTAQVVSSLPVVRLSEHSMGSPFNGVKEVLSPVAALGYGMICFLFLMNM